MIELEIVPYLPETKRGFKPEAPLYEIINAILYKLKTRVQWGYLPVESLFSDKKLHYKTVFGHYRKWCEQDVWRSCWIGSLDKNKKIYCHCYIQISSPDNVGKFMAT